MIIKKIEIENYLCYYENKLFKFSDGLNIILGENNEGKTKFFEALNWLLAGNNNGLENLVSARKIYEVSEGDEFVVSVSMTVEVFSEINQIKRSFTVKKGEESNFSVSNYSCVGIIEDKQGRRRIDGELLLNNIFPSEIREHYSMFSGEEALDIFKKENALINLINFFSDTKHYNQYSVKGDYLKIKAEKAVEESTRLNQRNQREYNLLESEISELLRKKEQYKVYFNSTELEILKLDKNINEVKKYVANAEALELINKRIKNINEEISKHERLIDENYTTSLFDENWILVNFEPFQKDFAEKISTHSKIRRELQSEFDKQKGIIEGEKKVKAELLNNAIPLPDNIPSRAVMEEMIGEEICKVCNREAKKGSVEYEFMMTRLHAYLESQAIEENKPENDETLFKFDYTKRLEYMNTNHDNNLKNIRLIKTKIKDVFEFNDSRKKDIEALKEKLEEAKSEQERILGNSNIAEDRLFGNLRNYNSWQESLIDKNKEIRDYETILNEIDSNLKTKKAQKDRIDTNNANRFLIKTRDILRDIETIFNETKEKKFDDFILKLEDKSNQFLEKINPDAFTGKIRFVKKKTARDEIKVDIILIEQGGRSFNTGKAVETSKNIAILLAISELANEVRNDTYPLILDAPISSFGETKAGDFLNLIFDTSIQKIILLKDFVGSIKDENGKLIEYYVKEEFNNIKRHRAFWVKLERPIISDELRSINTIIEKL